RFPDGAMFAKLAFLTADDPAFPVSAEPTTWMRVQVMKKDAARYARTGGWGYFLEVSLPDKSYRREQAQTVTACHACHALVPGRDFVFSRAAFVPPAASGDEPDLEKRFA